jgi:serine/threonine protein kinase
MLNMIRKLFPGGSGRYGGYRPLEEVAHGGMSRIYRGRNAKTGQICALKILTPESKETMERFRRVFEAEEGEIALRLDHPNVIKTYGYGHGPKGEYYIAMEYVDGPNLATLIAVQSLELAKRCFDFILQIGSGLAYIHEQGLIHRDFCPKNVLLAHGTTPKIIDFGLTIPESLRRRSVVSRAGTASYMAPEQVRSLPLDVRADIYAFGITAFEMLTGETPIPRSGTRSRRMQDHLNVEPRRLRRLAPWLPKAMESTVQKCIAKDRELRYKSMREVLTDLEAAVAVARAQPSGGSPG